MTSQLFITCQETLEPLLVQELQELGFLEATPAFCGAYIAASMEAIYKVNYCSAIAGRVLEPIEKFACSSKEELYERVKKIEWDRYILDHKTFAIDVNGVHPQFRNTFYAAQVAKDAICDFFREKKGSRPNVCVKNPDIQLNLFLRGNSAILSFDTSGEPLFKRGYRKEAVAAPIQESLAAALLRLGGYRGEEILLDPCCGSGTFLIEAALVASKTAPGFYRKQWGFFHHPSFSQEDFAVFKQEADAKRIEIPKGKLFGYDINKDSVRIAQTTARFAGFHEAISIRTQNFKEPWHIEPNFVICNPPHGGRLGDTETLKDLYLSLGDCFKQRIAKGGRAFVFTSSLELSKAVGLKPKQRHVIKSSGQECRLLEFEIFKEQA